MEKSCVVVDDDHCATLNTGSESMVIECYGPKRELLTESLKGVIEGWLVNEAAEVLK